MPPRDSKDYQDSRLACMYRCPYSEIFYRGCGLLLVMDQELHYYHSTNLSTALEKY